MAITRRKFLQSSLIASAGLSSLSYQSFTQANEPGIKDQFAPELAIDQWIGAGGQAIEPFKVSDHAGKWVFLKCFQNWCPGCHAHGFPTLVEMVKHFGNHEKVAIAAIQTAFEGFHTNNFEALRKNQLRYEIDIPFGHDSGDVEAPHGAFERYPKTMVDYRTGGTPWIILIAPTGHVVFNNYSINTEQLIQYLKEQVKTA